MLPIIIKSIHLPKVSIIILNYNGWQDTLECLESVYKINYVNYSVIIIDNNSGDCSIEKLKEYGLKRNLNLKYFRYKNGVLSAANDNKNEFEEETENYNSNFPIKSFLISNKENSGFAEGNNIGIRFSLKELEPNYVLLLNNDTIVNKDFLIEMIKVGEKKKENGILGPKIYYYNDKDVLQSTSVKIDFNKGKSLIIGVNEEDNGQYDKISKGDYVPGTCFLVKVHVFEKIGLLDKGFFCYWEETDFCCRARKIGFNCMYVPKSMIWHKVSESSKKITGFKNYYNTRNMFWFFKKNFSKGSYLNILIYFFLFRFWHQLLNYLILDRRRKLITCFIRGIWDGIFKSS